jgi:hypothetical protein
MPGHRHGQHREQESPPQVPAGAVMVLPDHVHDHDISPAGDPVVGIIVQGVLSSSDQAQRPCLEAVCCSGLSHIARPPNPTG